MRKGFERELLEYSGNIKEGANSNPKKEKKRLRELVENQTENINKVEAGGDVDDHNITILNEELMAGSNHILNKEQIDQLTKEKIYSLQTQKQQIMAELKHHLRCVSNPDCHFDKLPEEREAEYNEETGQMIYVDDKNQQRSATFVEIVTDMDFGIDYHLDSTSVPARQQKEYLIAKAKHDLRELLDEQIILSETNNNKVHEYLKETYNEITLYKKEQARILEENEERREKFGFVAEKIVKNFLRQLAEDKELPFEINEVDVYQDVVQKMDFIIHKIDRAIGVEVKAESSIEDVAIQFTTNWSKIEKKTEQIDKTKEFMRKRNDRIKEIALVSFSEIMVGKLQDKWIEDGRPAGGPGKYMSFNTQKKLFKEVLKNLFTEEEVDEMWGGNEGLLKAVA